MTDTILPPLVVDLDGTLTPTDTLVESLVRLLKLRPLALLSLPIWLLRGRAELKAWVASCVSLDADQIPYHEPLLEYLRAQKATGRTLVMATATHRRVAERIAKKLALFDDVIATDGDNLKGSAKLQAIRERVGPQFSYAGDSNADIPIWEGAASAVIVGSPRGLGSLRKSLMIEREFALPHAGATTWLKAIRAHQWLKNLLLFVSLLTSFSFMQPEKVAVSVIAFASFCLAASSTYLVNDLWDLDNDRAHPNKRTRPLASGKIRIPQAIAASVLMLATAFALAVRVGPAFTATLLTYLAITSAYSWRLKQVILVDVMALAVLYVIRIIAGSQAIGVETSSWLLSFSILIFFSLALVKRCSELVLLQAKSAPSSRGRDYNCSDLPILLPLGVSSGICSTIVFLLFINSPDASARYATPTLMWLVGLGLMYWISRLWIKTVRGEMHDDPLVYTLRDRSSRLAIATMILCTLAAHLFRVNI